MSKRTRGTARTTHRRPGTRPPSTRPAGARPTAARARLSEAAAENEVELVLEGPADVGDGPPGTAGARPEAASAARPTRARHRVKPGSLLAARAATEYVYVGQDIRRILLVSAVLFGIMLALYLLLVVGRVIPLPFY